MIYLPNQNCFPKKRVLLVIANFTVNDSFVFLAFVLLLCLAVTLTGWLLFAEV